MGKNTTFLRQQIQQFIFKNYSLLQVTVTTRETDYDLGRVGEKKWDR